MKRVLCLLLFLLCLCFTLVSCKEDGKEEVAKTEQNQENGAEKKIKTEYSDGRVGGYINIEDLLN